MALKDYWQTEKDRQDVAVTAIGAKAAAASADLQAKKAALAVEQTRFLKLDKEIAASRAALAGATIPADAAALIAVLELKVINQRKSQGKLLDLDEDASAAAAALDATMAALAVAKQAQATATAELATALREHAQRAVARTAITTVPLSSIGASAAAALAGPVHATAETELDTIPGNLIALATGQFNRQKQRLAAAEAAIETAAVALDTQAVAASGLGGTVAVKARLFRAAERKVLWIARAGFSELDRALSLFAGVSRTPLLSPAEITNVSFTTARDAAATEALGVVNAAAQLDQRTGTYEGALFTAQTADVDANPNVAGPVVIAKGAADAQRTALAALRADFTESGDLEGWTLVLPDAVWRKVRDFLEATDILTRLSALPGTAAADLDAAETAYVAALDAAAKVERTRAFLQATEDARQARRDQLAGVGDVRLFSAVRSDSV